MRLANHPIVAVRVGKLTAPGETHCGGLRIGISGGRFRCLPRVFELGLEFGGLDLGALHGLGAI
jgi:hypothetical protein